MPRGETSAKIDWVEMKIRTSIKGPRGKRFPITVKVNADKGCAQIVEGFGRGYEWGWKPIRARPWLTMIEDSE